MMRARKLEVLVSATLILGGFAVSCENDDGTTFGSATPEASATRPAVTYNSVSGDDATSERRVMVVADTRAFSPGSVTIAAGSTTTITLDNMSDEPHTLTVYEASEPTGTVVADTGEVVAGAMGEAVVLLTAGEHAFRCEIHADMRGVIFVR